jgi:3-isopropylmalate/(R)-2-methylmalate dehydratase small subunit
VVPPDVHARLLKSPGIMLRVDLETETLAFPDGRKVGFEIDSFAKQCLLEGVDELGYMLKQEPAIAAYEANRTGSINTLA